MTLEKWSALVLAGSRGGNDPVAVAADVKYKAFAKIAGKTMIARVGDTLAAVPSIATMAVMINEDADGVPPRFQRLNPEASPAAGVLAAMQELPLPILVTTADNPLLRPETLEIFLRDAAASGADIAAGICLRETVERAGNPASRTYWRFNDGALSGCNLFALMRPEAVEAVRFWIMLEHERKKPWRMVKRFGLGLLLRYLTGRLSRDDAAAAIGNVTGCKAALILVDDPLAAHDIDKLADLVFAEKCLSAKVSLTASS